MSDSPSGPNITALPLKPSVEAVQYTPECIHEAIVLLAYCESRFSVGEPTSRAQAVTGEAYVALTTAPHGAHGFPSPEATRLAAQEAFDAYAKDKSGTLYWRITPEIAMSTRHQSYAYYMRLLISDKPRKT